MKGVFPYLLLFVMGAISIGGSVLIVLLLGGAHL